jgi:anion-transporting  ArsA/GET3 family ATPase
MLSDVADFLIDLRTMYDALSARSRTIERYLRSSHTLIATTADPTPLHETHRFFRELEGIRIAPAGIIFNRALPGEWLVDVDRPLRGIEDAELRANAKANLREWASEARRQGDAIVELSARYARAVHTVRWQSPPPDSLEDLGDLIATSGIVDVLALGD